MITKKKCPTCKGEFEGKRKYCCYGCSITATVEANKQLKNKKGPIYEKWKSRLRASLKRI